MLEVNATIMSKVQLCLQMCLSYNLQTTGANLMKLTEIKNILRRYVMHTSKAPTFKVKATIRGQRSSQLSAIT